MAWGTKYYAEWTEHHTGVVHRINIMKDAYAGATTRLRPTNNPLNRRYTNLSKIEESTIQESEAVFSFLVLRDNIGDYNDIFNSEYREWLIEHKEDGALSWYGYVQTDRMSRVLINRHIEVTLTCTDALKDLRDVRYTPEIAGGFERASIMSVIKSAIAPVGIELDFCVQVDIYEQTYGSSTVLAWKYTHINRMRFVQDRNGATDYDTCYEVLEKILKSWNVVLKQSGGQYHFLHKLRPKQSGYVIAYADLSQGATKQPASVIDISAKETFRYGGSLTKIPPLKELDITFHNRNIGGKVADVDFNDWGITGPWTVNFDNFSQITPGALGVNELLIESDQTEASAMTIALTSPFTLTKVTDNDYIQLSFFHKIVDATETFESIANSLRMRMQIVRPDGTTHTTGLFHLSRSTDYIQFTSPVTPELRITDSGSYNITLLFDIESSSATYSFKIKMTQFALQGLVTNEDGDLVDDISYDRLYKSIYTPGKRIEKTQVYFLDTLNNADIAAMYALSFPGYANTNSWWDGYYWGANGYLPFLNIFARDYMTIRQNYVDYTTFDILDTDNEIKPHSVLELDGKDYIIVGYDRSYRTAQLRLTCVENVQTPIVVNIEEYVLSSIDGQSTRGSTVVQVAGSVTEVDPVFVAWRDDTRTANTVLAGPTTGAAAVPTFRALVAADIPDLSATYVTATLTDGYIPKATGASSLGDSAIFQSGSNIGIGTSPGVNLDVGGIGNNSSIRVNRATWADDNNNVSFVNNSGGAILFYNRVGSSGGNLAYRFHVTTSHTQALDIHNNGNVGIGTTSPGARTEISNPVESANNLLRLTGTRSYTFATHDELGGGRNLRFYGGDSKEYLYFHRSGNVGLGTTDPTRTLDINGALRIRTLTAQTGYANVLVADADGNVDYVLKSTFQTALTPAALTRTNDTNITLTLGGTPTAALLQAVSVTAGWTGTLSATRGGTGTGTYTTGDILYASATNTLSKLSAGINGHVLTLASGVPTWQTPTNYRYSLTKTGIDVNLVNDLPDTISGYKHYGVQLGVRGWYDNLWQIGTGGIYYTGASSFENVGINTSIPAQRLHVEGSIRIPATTVAASTVGIIYKGTQRFIHDYRAISDGPGTLSDGQNTFVGIESGNLSLTGGDSDISSYNTGCGYYTLRALTTGNSNTAIGTQSQRLTSDGQVNTSVGAFSLYNHTHGNLNTAIGGSALLNLQFISGQICADNTAIGSWAGALRGVSNDTFTHGYENIYIGAWSRASANAVRNEIVIGHQAVGAGSNTATIGNSSLTGLFTTDAAYHYFGADANNSWRIGRSGDNLVIQRKESGSWVTKQTISA